ncbi:MAG: GIY-YIG nuclease family protein [Bacteroidota bacterium]
MHYLYIIFSETMKKFYIGETSDVENRLIQHNTHYFKTNFTKGAEDWIIKLKFPTKSKDEAVLLERFIKKMKSRKFIEKIISKPSILTEILEKEK